MTDREMLELAAKAAGYPLGIFECGFFIAGQEPLREWNPLRSDGDAVRLATILGIAVYHHMTTDEVEATLYGCDEPISREWRSTDPDAATRRVIVRAAAAIGGTKP